MTDFGAQDGIDLPGIRFGIHTTLGYAEAGPLNAPQSCLESR